MGYIKNETLFLLNSAGKKAAKYMLTYFLLKFISNAYKYFSIDPRFFNFKIENVDIEDNIVEL